MDNTLVDNTEAGIGQPYAADHQELLQFFRNSLRKASWLYVFWLFMALMLATIVLYATKGSPSMSLWPSQAVYLMVLSFHVIYRSQQWGRKVFLVPDVVFALFYSVVHLGYISLYTLSIVPFNDEVIFFESALPESLFAINIGLIAFLAGFELYGPRKEVLAEAYYLRVPSTLWGTAGCGLILFGLLMHVFGLVTLGFGTISAYGYAAIAGAYRFGASYLTVFSLRLSILVITMGIVIYLIYSVFRYKKLFNSQFVAGLVGCCILLVILEGDRGPILKFGLPIILVRHYFLKKIKLRFLVLLFVGMVLLFAAIGLVRTTVFNPSKMYQEYQHQKTTGSVAWYTTFAELGGSFNTLNVTVHEVPHNEPYWKGASWRDSIYHMVPFLQGLALQKGWSTWSPSKWVTDTYWGPDRAGRGFSVVAEGYLNFGFPGVFIQLFFCGMFLRWLLIRFCKNPSAKWAFIFLACMSLLILVTRNHFNLLLAPCLQIIVLAWLLETALRNDYAELISSECNLLSYSHNGG